jgi:hypothetical protein
VVELVGLPVVDLMAGLAEAVAMEDALLAEAEGMGNHRCLAGRSGRQASLSYCTASAGTL